jgi:hypothetical protein
MTRPDNILKEAIALIGGGQVVAISSSRICSE